MIPIPVRFHALRLRVNTEVGREVDATALLDLLLDYAEGDEATFMKWVARQPVAP